MTNGSTKKLKGKKKFRQKKYDRQYYRKMKYIATNANIKNKNELNKEPKVIYINEQEKEDTIQS
jgi:ABC-type uncharacterized transport system substrate-binding protein